MRDLARRLIDKHPLAVLLVVGLFLRVVAAFFARGYMAIDDHFHVIEIAAQWLRGHPEYLSGNDIFYRTLLYPGVNWLLMWVLHHVGVLHPDTVMLFDRLAHAAFSLWTIVLAYKLALHLAGRRAAWQAGLLCAAHAVMPYVSVRNLTEAVTMPLLLYGVYLIAVAETQPQPARTLRPWVIAGLTMGVAVVLRLQIASALVGIGLYLIFRRRLIECLILATSTLVPILLQGVWDWASHGVFLGSLWGNLVENVGNLYVVPGPWYRFVLLILGIFIPPFSLLFVAAMIRWSRSIGVVAWAAWAFFIAHSVIPNKQERFLIPIFALLAVMGAVGLRHWEVTGSARFGRWIRRGWIWFWAVNIPLLGLALTNYSQRAKVESLLALYDRGDASGIVMDYTEGGVGTMLPLFYLDGANHSHPLPDIQVCLNEREIDSLRAVFADASASRPPINYAVIFTQSKLDEHLAMWRTHWGAVEVVDHFRPSIMERLLVYFNPRHHQFREAWLCRLAPPVR